MTLYKVTQERSTYDINLEENRKIVSENLYRNFSNAKKEYYRMKKHYISCKPWGIEEEKNFSGVFANFWHITAKFKDYDYTTRIAVLETSD